ncbi:MAG TPA: hypothetical protein VGL58_14425 [Caulobacteraceae bacterium]|jgi:hypothetical protein
MRTDPIVVQQWRDLRSMLIKQLDMFQTGQLSLKAAGVDISLAAIADLKRSILDFDALILDDETQAAAT